jgi:hypothetical protein
VAQLAQAEAAYRKAVALRLHLEAQLQLRQTALSLRRAQKVLDKNGRQPLAHVDPADPFDLDASLDWGDALPPASGLEVEAGGGVRPDAWLSPMSQRVRARLAPRGHLSLNADPAGLFSSARSETGDIVRHMGGASAAHRRAVARAALDGDEGSGSAAAWTEAALPAAAAAADDDQLTGAWTRGGGGGGLGSDEEREEILTHGGQQGSGSDCGPRARSPSLLASQRRVAALESRVLRTPAEDGAPAPPARSAPRLPTQGLHARVCMRVG